MAEEAAISPARGRGLPRGFSWILIALGCLLLTLLFAFLLFPYQRFQEVGASQLEAMLGAEIAVSKVAGSLSLGGPALRAENVRATWPDGGEISLDTARVRPAWSLSWFRGQPALHLDLSGGYGNIRGAYWYGDALAFAGSIKGLDLDRIPRALMPEPLPFSGLFDAEIDLRMSNGKPVGQVDFEGGDGAVTLPDLPVALPYDEFKGELRFQDDGAIVLTGISLQGPMVSFTAEGSIGPGPSLDHAPLDIPVQIHVVDPNVRPMIAGATGLRLDPEGRAEGTLVGTLASPDFR